MFKLSLLQGAAFGVLVLSCASAALAQENAELSSVTVSTAVASEAVTATKGASPLIELPRSVSVVSQQELRLRQPETVMQALQYSAGFNGQLNGRARTRGYSYVRGFLSYQYLDGLKLLDRNWAIEPYGIQSVDLLRGPASALYGQSAPGGLIGMSSKLPTEQFGGEVFIQGGSYDRVAGGFDVGGPLDDKGQFLFRVVGMARSAGTEQVHTSDSRWHIAPSLTWKIGPRTKLTLLGSYQVDPNFTFINYALPTLGSLTRSNFGYIPRSTFLGDPNFDSNRKRQSMVGYLFQHDFGNGLVLSQNARFTEINNNLRYMNASTLAADQRTLARRTARVNEYMQMAQIDTRLTYKLQTGPAVHDLLVGFDYATMPYAQASGTGTGPNLDLYAPSYGLTVLDPPITTKRNQRQHQTGVYAQDQIALGGLHLIFSGRQDWAWNSTYNRTLATGVQTTPVVTDNKKFTGQASALYEFSNGLAPYVSYSTSFYPVGGLDFGGKAFDPTTGQGVEGGLKFKPKGIDALFTASVYRITQQNVLTSDPAHVGFNIQTGEVRSRGYELEAKVSPVKRLNLIASYTHTDARVTRSNTVSLGKRPFSVPTNQAAGWVDYRFDFGLLIGGGVTHFGPSWGDAGNTFKVPGYEIADAMVGYDFSAWGKGWRGMDVQLNALNVFDKRYVSACDAANDCFYGLPRTVKVTLRKSF